MGAAKKGAEEISWALCCRQWGATEGLMVGAPPEQMCNLGAVRRMDWRLQRGLGVKANTTEHLLCNRQ